MIRLLIVKPSRGFQKNLLCCKRPALPTPCTGAEEILQVCWEYDTFCCEWLVAIQTGKKRGSLQTQKKSQSHPNRELVQPKVCKVLKLCSLISHGVSCQWLVRLEPGSTERLTLSQISDGHQQELGEDPYEWKWPTGLTMACGMDFISTVFHNFWWHQPCRTLGKGGLQCLSDLVRWQLWLCPRDSTRECEILCTSETSRSVML